MTKDNIEENNEEEPIQLDETPSGKEEALQFSNPEEKQKHLELASYKQDMTESKCFADRAYGITQTWVGFLIVVTIAQMLLKDVKMGLSENEFIVVFTTTTASVFGFWVLVGRYLFNNKK
jgi:hypothetical protein